MEQFGVENLKKVVQFGAKLGEGVADILEDGKVELGEAAALLPTLMEVPGILANKDKIKQEAADLSDDERAELKEASTRVPDGVKAMIVTERATGNAKTYSKKANPLFNAAYLQVKAQQAVKGAGEKADGELDLF